MKIFSKDLLRALVVTSKAVAAKPMLPVYECYYLVAKDGQMTVKASDGNITLSAVVTCEGECELVVPAKNLMDYVKALPECSISLEVVGGQVEIRWQNGHSMLPIKDASEWPTNNDTQEGGMTLSVASLKNALAHVINSSANDELRPVLCGVYFDVENKAVASTDGHICSVFPIDGLEGESFVMPKTLASFIASVEGDENATLSHDGNSIYFTCGAVSANARKVEGKYPNYKGIFPQQFTSTLTVDRRSLIGTILRVGVCASKTVKTLRFKLGMMSEVIAQDIDFAVSANETLDGSTYDGSELEIGFNGDYLISLLKQMTSDNIMLHLNGSDKGVVFDGDDSINILMPILLN